LLTQCLVRIEDTQRERARVDGRFGSLHQALDAGAVGDDSPGEGGGGTGDSVGVVGGDAHQIFSASECLFGFDLGAEPRVRGARIAFEHLDTQMTAGDRTAGPAGDEPVQRPAELPSTQNPLLAVDQWNRLRQSVFGAVGVDPDREVLQLARGGFCGQDTVRIGFAFERQASQGPAVCGAIGIAGGAQTTAA